jgi:hypothetical protein
MHVCFGMWIFTDCDKELREIFWRPHRHLQGGLKDKGLRCDKWHAMQINGKCVNSMYLLLPNQIVGASNFLIRDNNWINHYFNET